MNRELSKQLSERLLSKVEVRQDGTGKGIIEISFKSEEELKRLLVTIG